MITICATFNWWPPNLKNTRLGMNVLKCWYQNCVWAIHTKWNKAEYTLYSEQRWRTGERGEMERCGEEAWGRVEQAGKEKGWVYLPGPYHFVVQTGHTTYHHHYVDKNHTTLEVQHTYYRWKIYMSDQTRSTIVLQCRRVNDFTEQAELPGITLKILN